MERDIKGIIGVEVLNSFCDPDSVWGLDKPFSDEEYTYACNGVLLLRVQRLESVENQPPEVVKLHKLPIGGGDSFIDLPEYVMPEKLRCASCNGTGYCATCPECDGQSFLEFFTEYNDYEVECETCDGIGTVAGGDKKCKDCGGTGDVYPSEAKLAHDFGNGKGLSAQILNSISSLPGVKINDHDISGAVPFIFDGGDGVLMCMNTDC